MIRAHHNAFRALLTTDPNPLTVHDEVSPNQAAGGYVVLEPDTGRDQSVNLADDHGLRVWTIRTRCVGDTVEQVQALMEKVDARVNRALPVVTGRSCTRIKQLLTRPVEHDRDTKPYRFYAVADWRFTTTPT